MLSVYFTIKSEVSDLGWAQLGSFWGLDWAYSLVGMGGWERC